MFFEGHCVQDCASPPHTLPGHSVLACHHPIFCPGSVAIKQLPACIFHS
ncbi:similar to L-CaBP2 (predicted), isoform CRA_b, partial [Rattus norvegicus]